MGLARYGWAPTIVERAPALRDGGQAVDFRGAAHLGVLERMGILDDVRRHAAPGGAVAFVDEHGTPVATMAAEMASGDVEILRGDLGRVLHAATARTTEYLWGDWITGLSETAAGVRVTFARGAAREFDLVIGADGLHSAVRALAFGRESQFVHYLGYHVAITSLEESTGVAGGRLYSVPGRTAGIVRAGNATRAIFYFDAISEVRMTALSTGRIALIGDAGYGGTIGGMGTGVAVVAAYVLAGELAAANGNHTEAFARYEARICKYAAQCQRGARSVGKFMAPRTRLGIAVRNASLKLAYLLPGKGLMERIAMERASDVTFGDYPGTIAPSIAPAMSGGPWMS